MKEKTFRIAFLISLFIAQMVCGQENPAALKKEKFNINKAEEDKIGYAQAIKVGNTIFVSGSVGWGRMEDALKLAYDEIETTLTAYHATFENVIKENLYTTAIDSVIRYKDIRLSYYGNDFPAATWVEVRRLYSPSLVVEIEVVAVIPEEAEQK
jgi:2-iminobutanoate/2-iminopropanoate deaminase